MYQKPVFITVMSFLFLGLALSFPVQIMLIFKHNPWDVGLILSKLTPLNYVLIALFSCTAYLTYNTKKYVFILLPFLNFFVFLNNFVVAEYGQIYTHAQTFFASTSFLLLTLSFYQDDIYQVYNDLKFRWWLTPKRFKKCIPVEVDYNGTTIKSSSFDLSETGLFIKNDDFFKIFKIEKNSEITVKLMHKDKIISLVGKVVRKNINNGTYPAGIGVQIVKNKCGNYLSLNKSLMAS